MLQNTKFTIDNSSVEVSAFLRERGNEWVLMLHGLQSNSDLFQDLILVLQALPVSLLAIDLVGFGHSSKPPDFDYDIGHQATIIEKLFASLGLQRVHIIGHSLGGMVGTLLLDRITNKVPSLITLEGNLTLPDCGASAKAAALPFNEFQGSFYPALMQQLRTSNEPSAALRLEAVELIPDFVFYKTSQSIVSWSRDGKLHQIFSESVVPKLLIRGAQSTFATTPPEQTCETTEIPEAGHFMLLDRPQITQDVIRNFLSKQISS